MAQKRRKKSSRSQSEAVTLVADEERITPDVDLKSTEEVIKKAPTPDPKVEGGGRGGQFIAIGGGLRVPASDK